MNARASAQYFDAKNPSFFGKVLVYLFVFIFASQGAWPLIVLAEEEPDSTPAVENTPLPEAESVIPVVEVVEPVDLEVDETNESEVTEESQSELPETVESEPESISDLEPLSEPSEEQVSTTTTSTVTASTTEVSTIATSTIATSTVATTTVATTNKATSIISSVATSTIATSTNLAFVTEKISVNIPNQLTSPITIENKSGATFSMRFLGDVSVMSEQDGDSILFREAASSTDLKYDVNEDGVKEFIILKDEQHPSIFQYELNVDEYDFIQVSPNFIDVYRRGHGGEPLYKLYSISAPYMEDAALNRSESITFSIDGNVLSLTPDAAWLANAQYPVVVDPTVEISVLNVHSHPVEGQNWSVDFVTIGTADLTITPADEATINEDEFTSISCGNEDRTADAQVLEGDVIFYSNWQCDEVARVTHLTLVTGNHHLIFDFGGVVADAYNAAVSWDGGAGTSEWEDADNWSNDAVPTSADDVVIASAVTVNLNAATTVNSLTLGVSGGGTASILNFDYDASTSPLTISNDLMVHSGASITHTIGTSVVVGRVNITTASTTIAGSITANSKGYAKDEGPGAGTLVAAGIGGSHGGLGGEGTQRPVTAVIVPASMVYGSMVAPTHLGSGGDSEGCDGGIGGGAIRLSVTGDFMLSGSVTANGGNGSACLYNGGGSGGSVYITAGTLLGAGSVTANGGTGQEGGGGGGRIAVYYTTDNSTITYGNHAGSSGVGSGTRYNGGAGTTYKKSAAQTYGDLIMENNSLGGSTEVVFGATPIGMEATDLLEFDSITATSSAYFYLATSTASSISASSTSVTLYGNGMYDATTTSSLTYDNLNWGNNGILRDSGGSFDAIDNGGALTVPLNAKFVSHFATSTTDVSRTYSSVTINGTVYHTANDDATTATTNLYKLIWRITGDLTINSGGSINVDGKGFDVSQGPGKGTGNGSTAASHGGVGGNNTAASAYGSLTEPTTLGSGGDNEISNAAPDGGGAIMLTVSGVTTINSGGTISADGNSGSNSGLWGVTGGSGGSIYLTTGTLSGAGTITVTGGDGANTGFGNVVHSGAGGRIAVYYTTDDSTITYNTSAGSASSNNKVGGSGTLYKKSAAQTYGDLVLNNGNRGTTATSSFGSTYVPYPTTFDNITISDRSYLNASSSITYNIYADFAWQNVHASSTITAFQISGSADNTLTRNGTLGIPVPIVINSTATTTLSNGLLASSTVTVSSGTLYTGSATSTITGLLTISGGKYLGGTATTTANAGLIISSGTLQGSTGVFDINGTFTQSGGTVYAASSTTISGDFSHSSGTFEGNNGTVTLDGTSQSVSGSTTFYNLTKSVTSADTLTFEASSTQTVTNTLVFSGAASNLLSLRSDSDGSQWEIDPQGTRSISYLDVQDSYNANALVINAVGTNSTNSGNNYNWIFTAPSFSQEDFRWYQNTDGLTPSDDLNITNATSSLTSTSSPARLRINVEVTGSQSVPADYSQFKLQYATSTSGDWADIGEHVSYEWWDSSFLNRRKITFDNSGAAENLANFPVAVILKESVGNIDYSKTQDNGEDIRFIDADGVTALNYEIEKWDESATSTVWVKVPQIDSGSNTDFIWMYYNNTSTSSAATTTGVWDSNYKAVWHMHNDPSTACSTTKELCDSTSNARHADASGGMTSSNLVDGQVGSAINFDGSNDEYTTGIAFSNFVSSSAGTMSAWVNVSETAPVVANTYRGNAIVTDTGVNLGIMQANIGGDRLWAYNWDGNEDRVAATYSYNAWVYVTWVHTGGNISIYKDGSFVSSTGSGNTASFGDLKIAKNDFQGTWFGGSIDELRMSNTARSASWIEAEYLTTANSFNTFNSEESVTEFIPFNFYNNASVTSSSTLTSTLLSTSNTVGTYQEGNPTPLNSGAITVGDRVEYDWALDLSDAADSTDYYFRIVERDGTVLGAYTNYAALSIDTGNSAPDLPSSLAPASVTSGGSITSLAPTFNFTLSDPDGADTVQYQFQLSTVSSFLSLVVDYLSALISQGGASFTVGQAEGSGTYYTGSASQSLTDLTNYYWRVRTFDNSGAVSSFAVANSGSIAFMTDTSSGSSGGGEEGGGGSGSSGSSSGNNGGGGGGGGIGSVIINGGATTTETTQVALTLYPPFSAVRMAISNSPSFDAVAVVPFTNYLPYWNLCEKNVCQPGTYSVYVKYYDGFGFPSQIYTDDIIVNKKTKADEPPGKPPRDTDLGAILTASLDGSSFTGSLQVAVGQGVYLRGSVSGKAPGEKVTYRFDCQSDALADGSYEAIIENTPRTTVTTGPICSYASPGYYLARVEVLGESPTAYDSMVIHVASVVPPVPPVVPPVIPPVEPPPTSTTTPPAPPPPTEQPPATTTLPSELPPASTTPPEEPEAITLPLPSPGEITGAIVGGIEEIAEGASAMAAYIARGIEQASQIVQSSEVVRGIGTMSIVPTILAIERSISISDLFVGVRSFTDIFYSFVGMMHGLFTAIGLRKRRRHWGTVYDSVTKQALDPAVVELVDANTGQVVEQSITDLYGKFGFLDKPGRYAIRANKTHYRFPSVLVTGNKDGAFENVYHGEIFVIENEEGVIVPNIPMDPLAEDWNQVEKKRLGIGESSFMFDSIIFIGLQILFWAGFVVTIFAAVTNPSVFNVLLALFYGVLAIFNKRIPNPRLWGRIVSAQKPVDGLVVQLAYDGAPESPIAKTVTNAHGKFFLKTNPGEYILTVKRIGDMTNEILLKTNVRVGKDRVFNDVVHIDNFSSF